MTLPTNKDENLLEENLRILKQYVPEVHPIENHPLAIRNMIITKCFKKVLGNDNKERISEHKVKKLFKMYSDEMIRNYDSSIDFGIGMDRHRRSIHGHDSVSCTFKTPTGRLYGDPFVRHIYFHSHCIERFKQRIDLAQFDGAVDYRGEMRERYSYGNIGMVTIFNKIITNGILRNKIYICSEGDDILIGNTASGAFAGIIYKDCFIVKTFLHKEMVKDYYWHPIVWKEEITPDTLIEVGLIEILNYTVLQIFKESFNQEKL